MQDRADGGGAADPLGDLVADIGGLKTGEYEHIGLAAERRCRRFRDADMGHEGGVELDLAVDQQIRPGGFHDGGRVHHAGHPVVPGASHGGKGQHGDARRATDEGGERIRRRHGDLRQFFHGRLDDQTAIGEHHHFVLRVVVFIEHHQEEA